jgi:uncharacterized protein (TIGR02466 family)
MNAVERERGTDHKAKTFLTTSPQQRFSRSARSALTASCRASVEGYPAGCYPANACESFGLARGCEVFNNGHQSTRTMVMLNSVFGLPIEVSPVAAHAETKQTILTEICKLSQDPRCFSPNPNERVYSDYSIGNDPATRKYRDMVIDSVKPNIENFSSHFAAKELEFGQIWFQRYEVDSFHGMHNHWPSSFSVVYYLEFDNAEHTATVFRNPNHLQIEQYNRRKIEFPKHFVPEVKEGDILFFPSFLDHYVPMNYSAKPRTIISFNFDLTG